MINCLEIEEIINLSKTNLETEIQDCSVLETNEYNTSESSSIYLKIGLLIIVLIIGSSLIYDWTKKNDEQN